MVLIKSPFTKQEFAEYYEFRWEQLRKPLGMPLGSERDHLEAQAYHCMAIHANNTVVGVGRIHESSEQIMQIRYMAVAGEFQKQGVGTAILQSLLSYAEDHRSSCCWLRARVDAVEFYQKAGFVNLGQISSELEIPHIRMEMSLSRS